LIGSCAENFDAEGLLKGEASNSSSLQRPLQTLVFGMLMRL
jgi:hypothetical protein